MAMLKNCSIIPISGTFLQLHYPVLFPLCNTFILLKIHILWDNLSIWLPIQRIVKLKYKLRFLKKIRINCIWIKRLLSCIDTLIYLLRIYHINLSYVVQYGYKYTIVCLTLGDYLLRFYHIRLSYVYSMVIHKQSFA